MFSKFDRTLVAIECLLINVNSFVTVFTIQNDLNDIRDGQSSYHPLSLSLEFIS